MIQCSVKKASVLLVVLCLIVSVMAGVVSADEVTPSNEEYTLSFNGVDSVFFGNATPVNAKAGTEVYITYTVDRIREGHNAPQHGVIGTDQPSLRYPYTEGGVICYSDNAPILEQGYTYFYKFTYTDEGFTYVAAKAKDGTSQWVWFDSRVGDETDNYKHFGIWFDCGNVSVRLTHVRCYDQNGNDLGVYAPKHRESLLDYATVRSTNDAVDHAYTINMEDATNLTISNAKQTSSDTVYMEYTVQKSSRTKIYQWGLVNHHAPMKNYPYPENGFMYYEMDVENPGAGYMLQEGASYIVTFQKRNGEFLTLVQKTYNGKTEFKEFASSIGTYLEEDPFYAIWLGEGADYPLNCELVNFKCYDENNNNLGVQTNDRRKTVTIEHHGEMEDYAGCEAVYLDSESRNTITLYADQRAKVIRDGISQSVTYKIKDDVLTLDFPSGEEAYTYYFQKFTSQDGVTYERLGHYTVSFVTGTGEDIEPVVLNASNGYLAARPENPTKAGAEFLGWYLSDGTEFDFSNIVDASMTLYAKWSDAPEFQKIYGSKINGMGTTDLIVALAVSLILLAAGGVISICVLKKGRKNEKTDK